MARTEEETHDEEEGERFNPEDEDVEKDVEGEEDAQGRLHVHMEEGKEAGAAGVEEEEVVDERVLRLREDDMDVDLTHARLKVSVHFGPWPRQRPHHGPSPHCRWFLWRCSDSSVSRFCLSGKTSSPMHRPWQRSPHFVT